MPKKITKGTSLKLILFLAALAGLSQFTQAQTSSMNYVLTYSPQVAITAASSLPTSTIGNVNQSIQYVDGLGRPIQTVQKQASPTLRDMVQPIVYDQYGREATKYLAYSILPNSPNDGSYKTTALTDQASFYANPGNANTWNAPGVPATNFPVASSSFEASPLDRVLERGASGDSWQLTGTTGASNPGHTVKLAYATNNAASLTTGTGYWAKNYGVNYLYTYDGHYLYKTTLSDLGSYPNDMLFVTVTKSENWVSTQSNPKWNTKEEYHDKLGRLILKRTYNYNSNTSQTETLSTYYIYDDFGNLTYVLPPGANPDAGNITQSVLDTWCYQYRYDGRNRAIGKKLPGKGWELTLYNNLDQPVATQDSVQQMKSPQEWMIVKYDAMGRVILTGIYQYSGSTAGTDYRATLQGFVDAQSSQWEGVSSGGNGYTTNTWPTSWTTTLTLNYYDNYNGVPGGLPYSYGGGSNMTRGLLAAKQTEILDSPTNTMLWTQQYYDDQNRIIKTYKQHYLGGVSSINNYDDITNTYNFPGSLVSSLRKNFINSSGTAALSVTINKSYTYDHVGRKLNTYMQVNSGTNVLLSSKIYNEIGQLYKKQIHSEDGTNFIETTTTSFNERGWVSEINSVHFDEKLFYNTTSGAVSASNASYDGNISEAWYNSPAVNNRGFIYTYDNLDRLTNSKYYQGSTYLGNLDERVSYDVMGNILALTRGDYGNTGFTYSGTFLYSNYIGNQLGNVQNNGNSFHSFVYDGNGNNTSNGTFSFDYNRLNRPSDVKQNGVVFNTYTYDADGNKLRKVSSASGYSTDYVLGILYRNNALFLIDDEDGRYFYGGGSPVYQYYLKDHLGNVRVIIQKNTSTTATVDQDNEYYAFGLAVTRYDFASQNKYLYSSKEIQDENNLNQYDFNARFYDPVVARWNSIDLLSEKSRMWSEYNFTMGNPIRLIDPDGMRVIPLVGGYSFTSDDDSNDAADAFSIWRTSYEAKHKNNTWLGSIGIITFGKEEVFGKAIKELFPQAVYENVNADKGHGGYDDFYAAIKNISNQSPNGIGFLAIFSHGDVDPNYNRPSYATGMIFANNSLNREAGNVYTSDLKKLGRAVKAGDVRFASYSIIYLGGCNAATTYYDGTSFAMEMAHATGAYVYGVANTHMDAKNPNDKHNTVFFPDPDDRMYGGQLVKDYWPAWSPFGNSTPADNQTADIPAMIRSYLGLGN